MAARSKVLVLYKQMLREGRSFSNYNFREYAIRRVRDGFQQGKGETDASKISQLIKSAEENLSVMKRQALVGQLYRDNGMVLEAMKK